MGERTSFFLTIQGENIERYHDFEVKDPKRLIKEFLKELGLKKIIKKTISCFNDALITYEESEELRAEYIRSNFPPTEWESEREEKKGFWTDEITVQSFGYKVSITVTGEDHFDREICNKYFSE